MMVIDNNEFNESYVNENVNYLLENDNLLEEDNNLSSENDNLLEEDNNLSSENNNFSKLENESLYDSFDDENTFETLQKGLYSSSDDELSDNDINLVVGNI